MERVCSKCGEPDKGHDIDRCRIHQLADAKAEVARLTKERDELREALQAAVDDLRLRGREDSDGIVVVDIGSGVWMQMNDALNGEEGE